MITLMMMADRDSDGADDDDLAGQVAPPLSGDRPKVRLTFALG